MKYSIRDFAWLVLAIGLGLGWYLDRSVLSAQRDAYSERLHEVEERVGTDFDVSLSFDEIIDREYQKAKAEEDAELRRYLERDMPESCFSECEFEIETDEAPEPASPVGLNADGSDEEADSTQVSPAEVVKFISAFDREGRDFCEFCEKEFGFDRPQRRVYVISVGIAR